MKQETTMNKTIDFTVEIAQLLHFVGATATAIRMYSAYNPGGFGAGHFGNKRVDPNRSPVDLMFLADALHHLDRLGSVVRCGDPQDIAETCSNMILIYTRYGTHVPEFGDRQAKPAFELWKDLIRLEDACLIFASIRTKALRAIAPETT